MRRRFVLATVAVAVAGILVLGVPLAVAARRVVRNDALRRLDRQADAIGFAIDDDIEAGRPVKAAKLEHFVEDTRYVEVIDRTGRHTTAGRPVASRSLSTSITLPDGVTVRITEPEKPTDDRAFAAVVLVAAFGVAGLLAATALALLVARRVSRPLEELAAVSRRLGSGDFSARMGRHGLAETDAVADALNDSAARIEQLVEAERQFSSNASHQLRTPLTALRLRLEELAVHGDPDVRAEAEAALTQADRLETTVDQLLALARGRPGADAEPLDVTALVGERVGHWTAPFASQGRTLQMSANGQAWTSVSAAALAQAVDALLDNALGHGAGTATVEVRRRPDHVEVLVGDEGGGVAPGEAQLIFERHVSLEGSTGVGLALARALVEAYGGRVDLIRSTPPVFRILLPAATNSPGFMSL